MGYFPSIHRDSQPLTQMLCHHFSHTRDDLIPICPDDSMPMTLNLRSDDTFVEDDGWRAASARCSDYLRRHEGQKVLYLEMGVGSNTP